MHVLGVSVPLCCLFFHFVMTVITMVDYVVYIKGEKRAEVALKKAHLGFSIVGLIMYGCCAAPLFVYAYKYGPSVSLRLDRLLGGIGVMFFLSSLPMVVIELILFLSINNQFNYPLDGMIFILHAIAAMVGGSITWFAYMRFAAGLFHRFRGPERQVVDDAERTPKRPQQVVFSTPLPGQPAVI